MQSSDEALAGLAEEFGFPSDSGLGEEEFDFPLDSELRIVVLDGKGKPLANVSGENVTAQCDEENVKEKFPKVLMEKLDEYARRTESLADIRARIAREGPQGPLLDLFYGRCRESKRYSLYAELIELLSLCEDISGEMRNERRVVLLREWLFMTEQDDDATKLYQECLASFLIQAPKHRESAPLLKRVMAAWREGKFDLKETAAPFFGNLRDGLEKTSDRGALENLLAQAEKLVEASLDDARNGLQKLEKKLKKKRKKGRKAHFNLPLEFAVRLGDAEAVIRIMDEKYKDQPEIPGRYGYWLRKAKEKQERK